MSNTDPQVLITPLKPALIHGMAQKLSVLIRVQAPDRDLASKVERNPYHLSLVIDRSGSMSGEPLHEAVRCARYIVDQLDATDRASLVVFDDRVKVLAEAAPVGDRTHLYGALARIHSGGSTNLHGGWLSGMQSLLPKASEAALARVILLSDGNANVGETTETEVIALLCADAAQQGVTTSTYGLGRNFNEEMMVEMGKRGAGNHYYGDTAADLFEPFAEEFDLIANLHSRHVRLSLAAPQGIKINLMNEYAVETREGFPLIRLPDIPWGAEAWALVELEVSVGLALESGNQILQAAVSANTIDGIPVAYQDATENDLLLSVRGENGWSPEPILLASAGALGYFNSVVLIGDEVSLYASVVRVGRTSIRVKIDTWARRGFGAETVKVTEGLFTYVAIGPDRRPRPVDAEGGAP